MAEKKFGVILSAKEMSLCQKALVDTLKGYSLEEAQPIWALIGKFAMAEEQKLKLPEGLSPNPKAAIDALGIALVEGFKSSPPPQDFASSIAYAMASAMDEQMITGFKTTGTTTGHLSTSQPNIQQLKKTIHAHNYGASPEDFKQAIEDLGAYSVLGKDLKAQLENPVLDPLGWKLPEGKESFIQMLKKHEVGKTQYEYSDKGFVAKFDPPLPFDFVDDKGIPYLDVYGEAGWKVKKVLKNLDYEQWPHFKALRVVQANGNPVLAIKMLRMMADMGLKEAKDAYEAKAWVQPNNALKEHMAATFNDCMAHNMVLEIADSEGPAPLRVLNPQNLKSDGFFKVRVIRKGAMPTALVGLMKYLMGTSFSDAEKAVLSGAWRHTSCTVAEMESHPHFQKLMNGGCCLEINPV